MKFLTTPPKKIRPTAENFLIKVRKRLKKKILQERVPQKVSMDKMENVDLTKLPNNFFTLPFFFVQVSRMIEK